LDVYSRDYFQHWLLDKRKSKHSPALGIQEQEVPGLSSLRRVIARLDFATEGVDTAKCALILTPSRYASTDWRRNLILQNALPPPFSSIKLFHNTLGSIRKRSNISLQSTVSRVRQAVSGGQRTPYAACVRPAPEPPSPSHLPLNQST
jgi:hypothetical protein